MLCPRVYFNNIGSLCTDSLRHGNGLSALLLLTRAAKSSAAKSSASKTRSMESRLKDEIEGKNRKRPPYEENILEIAAFSEGASDWSTTL